MTTALLCDLQATPDGCVLTIEDADAHRTPDGLGVYLHGDRNTDTDIDATEPQRALWIRTMNIHECTTLGRLVRVRVLTGIKPHHRLGELAFNGHLDISSGILAIGDTRSPDRHLLSGPPSILRVSVYTSHTAEFIDDDYPVSGPSDITVLIHGDPHFRHAVADIPAPWWKRRRR